jgi:hypothetical protein
MAELRAKYQANLTPPVLPTLPGPNAALITEAVHEVKDEQEPPGAAILQEESNCGRGDIEKEIEKLRKTNTKLLERNNRLERQIKAQQMSADFVELDDKKCKYYTGLYWNTFVNIYAFLVTYLEPIKPVISFRDQFFQMLVRLRLDLPFEIISDGPGVATSTVQANFWTWTSLLVSKMGHLVNWPDRETMKTTLPAAFKYQYSKVTTIVDCFEIFIDRPSSPKTRAEVYSNYKKHSTAKVFIACTPLGSIGYLSPSWGGRATDLDIVRSDDFIDTKYHMPGDQIMADRGFTLQDDFAAACGCEIIMPSFMRGKPQLSSMDNEKGRQLSNLRIHIERVIGLLKTRFHILDGPLPINMVKSIKDHATDVDYVCIDKIIRACAVLVNLGESIVSTDYYPK